MFTEFETKLLYCSILSSSQLDWQLSHTLYKLVQMLHSSQGALHSIQSVHTEESKLLRELRFSLQNECFSKLDLLMEENGKFLPIHK